MDMSEYSAYRQHIGLDKRGVDNLGRAPGHERQEYLGHRLSDGSGFPSWSDTSANHRVYASQLGERYH
jgi:hypothetical protein